MSNEDQKDMRKKVTKGEGHLVAVNYSVLVMIIPVVIVFSAALGYWRSVAAFYPFILLREGYSSPELSTILRNRSNIGLIMAFGGSFLVLGISYYLSKQYKLGKKSTVVLLLASAVAVVTGSLIGYGVGQLEFPEYPILNIHNYFHFVSWFPYPILWSFVGILAGNYKRELEKTPSEQI